MNCELDETSDVKKLLCSVGSQTTISYEWSGPNINVHSGHELVVDKQEENLDSVYTCTVKNRVNSKSTDFTLKDCHTGLLTIIQHKCLRCIETLMKMLYTVLNGFVCRQRRVCCACSNLNSNSTSPHWAYCTGSILIYSI